MRRKTHRPARLGAVTATTLGLVGLLVLPAAAAPDRYRGESGHHRREARSYRDYARQPRGEVQVSYRDKSFGIRVNVGNTHHRSRYGKHSYGYRQGCAKNYDHWRHRPKGSYQRVWVPPCYRTVYSPCGTPRRVLVRHGYYKSVWVSGPRATHTRAAKIPR